MADLQWVNYRMPSIGVTIMEAILGVRLQSLLDAERRAGNVVARSHEQAFGHCRLLIILKEPFRTLKDPVPDGLEVFENHDSHYPVGRGIVDPERQAILLAPFG